MSAMVCYHQNLICNSGYQGGGVSGGDFSCSLKDFFFVRNKFLYFSHRTDYCGIRS